MSNPGVKGAGIPGSDEVLSSERGRRLWGVDLIAAIYFLAAILLGGLSLTGGSSELLVALVLIPVCLVVAIGLLLRVSLVRRLFLGLLGIAVVIECGLFLFNMAALAGWVRVAEWYDPAEYVREVAFRLALTAPMIWYLTRDKVTEAFGGSPKSEGVSG